MHLVFDTEGNGLLETESPLIKPIDKMWCIVAKDLVTKKVYKFEPDRVHEGVEFLAEADTLIGHHILGYDIPVMDMLYDFETEANLLDTLVWSRSLNPDRKLAYGCPTHYDALVYDINKVCRNIRGDKYHPMKTKKKLIGAHSIAAWAYKLGKVKPIHNDWLNYSPEMLHRCTEDTLINFKLMFALLKEAGMSLDQIINWKNMEVPSASTVATSIRTRRKMRSNT